MEFSFIQKSRQTIIADWAMKVFAVRYFSKHKYMFRAFRFVFVSVIATTSALLLRAIPLLFLCIIPLLALSYLSFYFLATALIEFVVVQPQPWVKDVIEMFSLLASLVIAFGIADFTRPYFERIPGVSHACALDAFLQNKCREFIRGH